MTLKVEMTKEKIAFIQKNEKKTYNFCGIAYFVYYKCFQRKAFNKVAYVIIVGTHNLLYKGGLSFQKFPEWGGTELPHKKGGVGKQGVVLEKEGYH